MFVSSQRFRVQFLRRPVKGVAYHRVSQRREMHSVLVRPPGFNLHVEQAEFAEDSIQSLTDEIVCNRQTATHAASRHTGTMHPVAADAASYCVAILSDPAMHKRDVLLL